MKENKIKNNDDVGGFPEISVNAVDSSPETSIDMVNLYGTYNIQPTANTENDFPAIAQGENKMMKERSLHFFRDADDKNPVSDGSDSDCIDS